MSIVFLKKSCLILILIFLTTCYYTSGFRLIHTHQTQEKDVKKEHRQTVDIKEHVRKSYSIREHHQDDKNETVTHLKTPESEIPTITPEKKVKTVQPTLPSESVKEKIKERIKISKVESEDETSVKPKLVKKKEEKEKKVVKKDDDKPKIKIVLPKEEVKPVQDEKPVKTVKKEVTKAAPVKAKEEIKTESSSKPATVKPKEKIPATVKPKEKIATTAKPKEKISTNVKPKEKIAATTVKPVEKPKTEKPEIPPKPYIKQDSDSILNLLYYNLPTFTPNFTMLQNEDCKKQGEILLDQLHQHKIWALKMFDSTAKIPSGILRGNLNQFGDYDQCVGIYTKIFDETKSSDVKISGKYCLANIDIEADVKDMKLPVHLAQGRAMIRSKLQDPGHFIPRFTTIRWGLCIPSGCTSQDAESILEHSLKIYNESNTVGLTFDVSVEPDQCYVRKASKNFWEYPVSTIITITLNVILLLLVIIATLRDLRFSQIDETPADEIKSENEKHDESTIEKLLMSFSLKRTSCSLLKHEADPDEIECIHGIRTICTFLLYIAHKLIPIGHLPFSNKITLTEISNNPLSIILRLSIIYTDSFLLLSGILTSYRMSKDIEEKGRIPWFSRIVARFVRLTPSLLFILLYYAYIMEYFGDGPLWNTIITPNANLCKEYWWRNILYIQNMYPFQDMCATHTHQLALDMQLSIIAPILVWLLYKRPFLGVFTTLLFHSISIILRYYTTLNYRLSLVIYHGISISQLYRTANFLYASSIYRATPYLAGIGLGVLLRQMKPNFCMPKVVAIFGWLIAGYFAGWALYSPSHLSNKSYQYDINEAAQFSALCSLAWALALSWLIFACFADNEGYLNKFLSSRLMVLFSRISYTLYLTQFIVFFYNVGTVRNTTEFKISSSLDLTEMSIVIIISILLTLLVDIPVQKIKSIILRSTFKSSHVEKSEETEITTLQASQHENNILKPALNNLIINDEQSDEEDKQHEDEEDKQHEDEEVEETKNILTAQLSTESQMSVEEDHFSDHEDTKQLITQLSTESQSIEDDEFDQEDDDNIQKITIRLSTDGKLSVQEQIEQILDEEDED